VTAVTKTEGLYKHMALPAAQISVCMCCNLYLYPVTLHDTVFNETVQYLNFEMFVDIHKSLIFLFLRQVTHRGNQLHVISFVQSFFLSAHWRNYVG
jgi:hypothetical protein